MNGRSSKSHRLAMGQPGRVLRDCERRRFTGLLRFRTAAGEAQVWFSKGALLDAQMEGLWGKRALFRLLGYRTSRYTVEARAVDRRRVIRRPVAEIEELADARRREWAALVTRLPPLSAVLESRTPPRAVELSTHERRLLGLIDGQRPLFALIDDSELDPVSVLRNVGRLLELGLVGSTPESGQCGDDDLAALGGPSSRGQPRPETGLDGSSGDEEPPSPVFPLLRRQPDPSSGGERATHPGMSEDPPAMAVGASPTVPVGDSTGSAPGDAEPTASSPADASENSVVDSAAGAGAPGAPKPVIVGRYEVLERIGRGGMATVYLCRTRGEGGFTRRFAMKVLRAHLCQSPEAIEMLLREARLTAQLHHPNVVSVIDVGSNRGQPYLVMDYVPGCSVADLLEPGVSEIPLRVATAIVVETLSGLFAAHTLADSRGVPLGLVHHDISPENLIVGCDGVTRVTDFGVAHIRDTFESSGEALGKPHYVSPERISTGVADHRSDLFSVGVVLYRLLTGVQLFAAPTVDEVFQNLLTQPILPPSQVGLRPPAIFDAICLRALERDPDLRYGSAEHFRADLLRAAVVSDTLGLSSEVAECVRRAVERSPDGAGREAIGFEEPAAPAQAIILTRNHEEEVPDGPNPIRAETTVLPAPRGRPGEQDRIPTWVAFLFLLVVIGGALLLDQLSASSEASLPEPTRIQPVPKDAPLDQKAPARSPETVPDGAAPSDSVVPLPKPEVTPAVEDFEESASPIEQ